MIYGNKGISPWSHKAWPWDRKASSGENFAKRIAATQLSIGEALAEGEALPPPPEIGTVLRRDDGPRASSKLWNEFRKRMKKEYGMNDQWLNTRAGPLKTMFGDMHHLRKYLQGLKMDEEKLGNYIKDIREATVRSMNDISKFNDLNINDGVFRKFLTEYVPEIDGKQTRALAVPEGGPTDQDPEQEDLVKKLTAWFQ